MKISLFLDRIAGRAGGAERVVVNVANQLITQGYQVEIITYEDTLGRPFYPLNCNVTLRNLKVTPALKPTKKEIRSKRISKYMERFECTPCLNKFAWFVKNRDKVNRVTEYFKDNPTDLIIGFLPSTFAVTYLVASKLNIKYVLSLHNVPKEDFENPARWDQNINDKKLRFKALANANANTVILDEFRNYFSESIKDHTYTVRNFITRPNHKSAPLLNRPKRVIAVGRLAKPKDHTTLISAWSIVHKLCPDWQLSIYGDGPLKNQLQTQITRAGLNTSITIHPPTKDIDSEYGDSQIFCIPSLFEGFGLVTVEAMAHSLPCIGFNSCPGTNRLITSRNGVLIDCSNSEKINALADTLIKVIQNSGLRVKLSAGAHQSAEGYFVENRIQDWFDLVHTILPN
ncbi:glycosyltransferase [Rubritalea spongiae]|uniref:Glycosyltransferase n=1 Tax=Rubritalea spongiae TaxID=430797 RepID=A0ABW5E442_9BACT